MRIFFCVILSLSAVYCERHEGEDSSRSLGNRGKLILPRRKVLFKNIDDKGHFYKTYGNLIISTQEVAKNNYSSPQPGDVITETSISSPILTLNDPTRNSTTGKQNIIDWFLGVVGLRPNENESSTPPNNSNQNLNCPKCTCGIALKHKRIIGGIETLVNQYPWMVALHYNNRFLCGGSLINNKYVLTAAHCVNGFSREKFSAVFLDHDRTNAYETTTFTRKVKRIIRHRSYGQDVTFNNDIALLELDNEVSLSDMTRPVCLPPTGKSFTGYNAIAVGWGATAQHGALSPKLREVKVPVMSNIDCRQTGYTSRITDNMLCAGFREGKKDSCQGDSGGPLHIINGIFHEVIGIVSWGEGCAQANYPGVYTRVNRYITWIKSNTKDACYC
ncbi:trypsin-1-like [Anthonomus grandis grandis]|uniref:trypsin-1-like n=1 Tax=Anthonomus grandis grandis TaxID=2921223 RepID=UPI002165DCE5|nr:trypsin-1-like [Anthonomus grandis grandis]